MTATATYGGNYDEWAIACPDGEVWPDAYTSAERARAVLPDADEDCGCGESPHVLVFRAVPGWERAS